MFILRKIWKKLKEERLSSIIQAFSTIIMVIVAFQSHNLSNKLFSEKVNQNNVLLSIIKSDSKEVLSKAILFSNIDLMKLSELSPKESFGTFTQLYMEKNLDVINDYSNLYSNLIGFDERVVDMIEAIEKLNGYIETYNKYIKEMSLKSINEQEITEKEKLFITSDCHSIIDYCYYLFYLIERISENACMKLHSNNELRISRYSIENINDMLHDESPYKNRESDIFINIKDNYKIFRIDTQRNR